MDHKHFVYLLISFTASKERSKLLETVRRRGNFMFNTNNEYNDGNLIVCRRPQSTKNRSVEHFIPCSNCQGFFSKIALRKHYRTCKPSAKVSRDRLVLGRKIYGQIHEAASYTLRVQVFPVLRDNLVTQYIRYDKLIILYGNKLCLKYRSPHHYPMIRARLRLIGRFMLEIRKINATFVKLQDVYNPSHYDEVIEAVNKVAQLNVELHKYKAPTTATSLGSYLKQCGNLLITELIKNNDVQQQKLVKNFLKLLVEDYATSITKTAYENQLEQKRQKIVQLPSNNDIKMLNIYLRDNRRTVYRLLSKKFDKSSWLELASLTLISVQVFNRRRAGEIERITINDYKSYQFVNEGTDLDVFSSLSSEAQVLTRQYARFVIRGKLARGVPVLVHQEIISCIDMILKYRQDAGVDRENKFVFGIPGGSYKYLRACVLLRKYSELCSATNPQLLRGTHLRKHIATQSVLLNLKEGDVRDLANFLGHSDKIHHDHYRLPIATREIVKISKLLEISQGNNSINASSVSSNEPSISLPIEDNYPQFESQLTCSTPTIALPSTSNDVTPPNESSHDSPNFSSSDIDPDYIPEETETSVKIKNGMFIIKLLILIFVTSTITICKTK